MTSTLYDRVCLLIIRGRIAPGTRVVEAELADRLGVSRTPAREVIRRLHQEGFLVPTSTTRRTELMVAPITRDDLLDLYHLMGALEGAAARRVDELDATARRALAKSLDRLEKEFQNAAREKKIDYDRVFDRHNAFHQAIIDACARPRLRAMIETVRPQVARYEWLYAPLVGPDFSETFAEHAAIVRAIKNGSAQVAERAMVSNWEQGANRLAAAVDHIGGQGDWTLMGEKK